MKTSKTSLFLFIIFYNFLLLRLIIFPYFYDMYGINGHLYIGVVLTIVSLLIMLIPKKIFNNNIFFDYIKSKFKYFYNFILILRIILLIGISAFIIHEMFYKDILPIFLILGFSIPIVTLSNLKPNEIIEIHTFFGIISLLFYTIYVSNITNIDVYMLFRNVEFKPNIFMIILFSLVIFFDNLLILFSNNKSLSKKHLLISLGICGAIFSFEYILFVLTAGDVLYKNVLFSGLMVFSISPISRFNGTFDFVYIFILSAACIFKNSYLLSLTNSEIKVDLKWKYFFNLFIVFLLSLLCYYLFINYIYILLYVILIVLLISGSLLIWMIWRYRNVQTI